MKQQVKRKLDEAWKNIKPYMNDKQSGETVKDLFKMCQYCEKWDVNGMDYEECRDMPCFQFWLAYEYLDWSASYE